MGAVKTVLCLQDLSCVGRCSLGVAVPALAAMGAQPCALPTALLSSHTYGFGAPARTDETAFLKDALAHYAAQGLAFNAVCRGYLNGAAQAALVAQAFRQNPGALKMADPVLGDNGRAYSYVTDELLQAMRALCQKADVLTPNVTEAALLLGQPPCGTAWDDAFLCARTAALQELYKHVGLFVVTGVRHADGRCGNVCAARGKAPVFLTYEEVPGYYPGTGDLFAAVLLGGLLRAEPPEDAVARAASFVGKAAARTALNGREARFGVEFEPLLHLLCAHRGRRVN